MPTKVVEVRFQTNLGSLQADMAAASAEVRGFGGELLNLGEKGNRGVRELGFALTGIGVALAAVDVLSLKSFAGLDERLRNVASITQDGAKAYGQYGAAVTAASEQTGQSANSIAEGLYKVASAGFTGKAGIDVMTQSAKAAEAGLTDTSTAAQAITGVLNAYGMTALNAGHVSDVLFNTVRVGQTNFGELAQQMGQFIGVAGQLHIPLEQVGAAFSTITVAGVPASEAGTALNRTLISLINPTQSLTELYHQWGFETGQQALEARGLSGVLQGITQAAGGNADALFKLVGDQRAFRGELALSANGGALYARQLSQFADVSGQTQKALEEQSKSLNHQLDVTGQSLAAAGRSMVGSFIGPIKDTAGFVADAAQGFSQLNPAVRDAVGITTALGGAVAIVGGGVLAYSRSLGAIITAMGRTATATEQMSTRLAEIPAAAGAGTAAIEAETAALARFDEVASATRAPQLALPGMGMGGPNAEVAAGGAVQGVLPGMEEAGAGAAGVAAGETAAATAGEGLAVSLGAVATGVGAVVGVAALGVMALSAFGHASKQAKDDQDALKESVDAFVQGQRQQAASLLLGSSAFSAILPQIRSYHLSIADVAQTIEGDSAAQARLTGELQKVAPIQAGVTGSTRDVAAAQRNLQAALAGSPQALASLEHAYLDHQITLGKNGDATISLIQRIQQLVGAHKIDAATARELAGALGQVNVGQANSAESAEADAVASLQDAAAKKVLNDQLTAVSTAMQQAGDPMKIMQDAQSQLNDAVSSGNKVATDQQKITKDNQTIQNDAAQSTLDQARAELELERTQQGVVTAARSVADAYKALNDAQQSYNDLLAFGLSEERQRLDIDAQSRLLDETDATKALADAQKKLSDIESGRVGMADSARPRAIADAQEAVARAQLQVQSATLAATDAQRQQAREGQTQAQEAADGAQKVADAQQKITDALLGQREASQQVAADQLAIAQQQNKLTQSSENAANAMGAAADKMAGAVGGAVGKVKLNFDQWTQAEEDRAGKMQKWFGDIIFLAQHGHKGVADEMLKMGIDSADYAAQAVQKVKSGEGLGGLETAMTTIAQLSTGNFAQNWDTAMTDLQKISHLQGQGVGDMLTKGLSDGTISLQDVINTYEKLVAAGANAIIVSIGGKPVVVTAAERQSSYAPGTAGPFLAHAAGGVDGHVANQPTILYGERETGGEAFVPKNSSDRRRMGEILGTAASWHGYALVDTAEGGGLFPMASGGIPNPPPLGSGAFNDQAAGLMQYIHDQAVAATAARQAQGGTPPSGPVPPGSVADWINQAIQLTGVPPSWAYGLYEIAMHESSGDPHSANNWDINAQQGNPSEGIMQTTISTFRGNAVPGHGDIWNPVDNIAAAIEYILHRYGDISNVPGVRSLAAGQGYRPYATGGIMGPNGLPISVMDSGAGVLDPGWNVVGNFTGMPEPMVRGGTGAGTVVHVHVARGFLQIEQNVSGGSDPKVFREVTEKVVGPAIEGAFRQLAQEISAR